MRKNKICGIYCIENIQNGLKYIGLAKDIAGRWNNHQNDLKGNRHRNSYLQRVYNKYGKEIFKYYIIQILEENLEILKLMEIYFIAYYNSYIGDGGGYNMTRGGEGTWGYKHTDEQRRIASEKQTGKKASEESRKKMSLFQLSRNQKEYSEEKEILSEKASISSQGNSFKENSTSQYVGVSLHKESGKWISSIRKRDKLIYIGIFLSEDNAAYAYNLKAYELYGENAKINIIREDISEDLLIKDIKKQESLRRLSSKKENSTSEFLGVSYDKKRNKYVVQICFDGKNYNYGRYEKEVFAAIAYNIRISEYYGEDAILNKISDNIDEEIIITKEFYREIRNPKKNKTATSKYFGVTKIKNSNKYMSYIKFDKKLLFIGNFDYETDAAIAYNFKAKELYGDNAKINIISDDFEKEKELLNEFMMRSKEPRKIKNTSNKFFGVYYRKDIKKYRAIFLFNKQKIHLGYFKSEIDAAEAYNKKASEILGDNARLNKIIKEENIDYI